jgi:hypothetical protein
VLNRVAKQEAEAEYIQESVTQGLRVVSNIEHEVDKQGFRTKRKVKNPA